MQIININLKLQNNSKFFYLFIIPDYKFKFQDKKNIKNDSLGILKVYYKPILRLSITLKTFTFFNFNPYCLLNYTSDFYLK
jgi:hypothetical protein